LSLGLACLCAEPLQDDSSQTAVNLPDPASIRFTPPPPPVIKRLPAVHIEASVTSLTNNGRTLTLQRGEPSTEPDHPPPPPPPHIEPREPTAEEIAKRIWHLHHNFNLGATVFDYKTSVVHWTDPISLVRYEAVCPFLSKLSSHGLMIDQGLMIPRPLGRCNGSHIRRQVIHLL
jgi:hypothetical protein